MKTSPTPQDPPRAGLSGATKVALVVLGLAAVAALFYFSPSLEQKLDDLSKWLRDAGALGVVAFAGVYILATLFAVPGVILTVAAGSVYGVWLGTAIALPVRVLAAIPPFFIARYLARDMVARRLEGHPKFAALDRATAEGGTFLVVLLRLSSLFPYNLTNYGLGVTQARFRDYVLGSLVGLAPATVRYVYVGSLVESLSDWREAAPKGGLSEVFFYGGLVATVVVTVVITKLATKKLSSELGPEPELAAAAPA